MIKAGSRVRVVATSNSWFGFEGEMKWEDDDYVCVRIDEDDYRVLQLSDLELIEVPHKPNNDPLPLPG
jgi:hypothetical protein